jgi:YVTN family beta-propeller protein
VQTGKRPRAIAFHGTRGVVGGENDASVTIVDTTSRSVVGRIELPRIGDATPRPAGIVIAPDGVHAYVATGRAGAIVVVDLDARRVVRTIEGVGARPWGIALGRDGRIYTANGPSDDVAVIEARSGEVVSRIHSGGSPWGVVSI